MPGGPAQGELAAEHAGGLLEKMKQGEEPGSSLLLGAKSCHPARDGHALGASILLPPRTRHV